MVLVGGVCQQQARRKYKRDLKNELVLFLFLFLQIPKKTESDWQDVTRYREARSLEQ